MSDDVQADDHLSQIARATGKGSTDSHDTDSGLRATANAPQLIQVNTLSTPVVVVILAVLTVVGMISAASAVFAYISERSVALTRYETEFALKEAGLTVPRERP